MEPEPCPTPRDTPIFAHLIGRLWRDIVLAPVQPIICCAADAAFMSELSAKRRPDAEQ